jgi:hypothetical protein
MARWDLFQPVCFLAGKITKWNRVCDKYLFELMCWIYSSLNLKMCGRINNSMSLLSLRVYTDADYAGDKATRKSTSGVLAIIVGPNSWFPINGSSGKQTCQSHSTPESEIVSLDKGVKDEAIPLLNLFDIIYERSVNCECMEDNEATITIVQKGYSRALRHIGRVHGCDVGFLHRCFHKPVLCEQLSLTYCPTNDMAADILTKHIVEPDKYTQGNGSVSLRCPRAPRGVQD